MFNKLTTSHGQTSANRTEPGPSFQLQKGLLVCHALMLLMIKTAQLKVESLAQTTFRFPPVLDYMHRLELFLVYSLFLVYCGPSEICLFLIKQIVIFFENFCQNEKKKSWIVLLRLQTVDKNCHRNYDPRSLYYKTFYSCNLHIFIISQ